MRSIRNATSRKTTTGLARMALGLLCASPATAYADDLGSFYAVPAREVPGAAGTLIRTEPVPAPPGAAAAYRIIYRSRDRDDRDIAVSGLAVLPPAIDGATQRPVVSWGHGTTGIASGCAPSRLPARAFDGIDGLHALLAKGYVVVATDYQGLGEPGQHPYLVGASEAHAMIDAVRAVRALPGAHAGARYATWGFSQGGHAALFTGSVARRYAPDLQLVGVAAASAPTELRPLLHDDIHSITGKVVATYAALSWSRTYDLPLDEIVRKQAVPNAERIASTCSFDLGDDLALGLDASGYQTTGLLRHHADRRPDWDRLIARNSVPVPGRVPVFLAQGVMDQIVEPRPTRDYVGKLCRDGVKVDYVEEPWASHGATARTSARSAVAWLAARFSGQNPTSTCANTLADASPEPALSTDR
ncbi:lipase family protein [Ancylobacter sp. VNQ12]|uniref:lipase family protein n=1 Tax=Ancylobacter sp. VNQ12 TaxID=3400920 RepID=UPI003C0B6428